MSELNIEVQERHQIGSAHSRRLRRADQIPAVVYGGGRDSKAIQVPRRVLLDVLKKGGSENAVVLLRLSGSDRQRHCMVRELEVHPVTREVQHVDFLRIDMTEKIQVEVAVELVGEPVGVRNEGGILDHINRTVEVLCLPGDIPRQLLVDVSELNIGQHVEAHELTLPENVELITDPDRVLASVVAPRLPEEEEEEEGELLLEAEAVEPELVGGRGKEEEEGEEEG